MLPAGAIRIVRFLLEDASAFVVSGMPRMQLRQVKLCLVGWSLWEVLTAICWGADDLIVGLQGVRCPMLGLKRANTGTQRNGIESCSSKRCCEVSFLLCWPSLRLSFLFSFSTCACTHDGSFSPLQGSLTERSAAFEDHRKCMGFLLPGYGMPADCPVQVEGRLQALGFSRPLWKYHSQVKPRLSCATWYFLTWFLFWAG